MNDTLHSTDSETVKPSSSMTDHYIKMVKQAFEAEKEAAEATARAKELRTKIEAVKKVLLDSGFPLPDIEERYTIKKKRKSGGGVKKGLPTWGSEIESIVKKHEYISYSDILDILAAGPMGANLAQSEKGFYGAMRRLEVNKKIVRHNSYAFTLAAYDAYKADVERGIRPELKGKNGWSRGDTVIEKVEQHLADHPLRLTAKEILEQLDLPNIGTLYNNLKKLVDSGEIVKDIDSSTYWHSKYSLEPETAVLPTPPSREGELALNEPSHSNG